LREIEIEKERKREREREREKEREEIIKIERKTKKGSLLEKRNLLRYEIQIRLR